MRTKKSINGDADRRGVALFATAIGRCGIAWGESGIVAVSFPDPRSETTLRRLRRRAPGAQVTSPPPHARRAIDGISELLAGEASDLTGIELDLDSVEPFERSVYRAARGISPGATHTYGELAAAIGRPSEAREVGRALGRNPFPIIVPCHRVVAAGGGLGGFSAPGGIGTKRRLLAIESRHGGGAATLFDGLQTHIA